MPANSLQEEAKTTRRRNGRGYRCIYRALLRACGKRDLLDVLRAAEVGGKTDGSRKTFRSKLRNGVPVEKKCFDQLASVLNCEATNLYFIPEDYLPRQDSPPYRFAIRVAELLADPDNGIPLIDPDTKEPPDVVRYAWEMADPELDSMPLTFKQEREAFIFLRDYLMVVIEEFAETERKHPRQIGAMIRGVTSPDDVIADVRAREATSMAAFDMLEEDWDDNNPFHIHRIKSSVPHRLELYLDAEKLDLTQWHCLNDKEADPAKREWKSKTGHISLELVRNLIDADFHLRKVIFPTHQQDVAFESYYGRSRQLIERVYHQSTETFPTWWNRFRDNNTSELKCFEAAWMPDAHDADPKWDAMRDALKSNLRRTIDQIMDHYPDDLLPKSRRRNEP